MAQDIAIALGGKAEAQKYEPFWYAALVQSKCENIVAKQISAMSSSLDVWVASRKEERQGNMQGKKRIIDVVCLPTYVFFRFPLGTPRNLKYSHILEIKKLTKCYRLVQSPGHAYGEWEGAHIPDEQIERLKFVLGMSQNPVCMHRHIYEKGDKVRVMRGCLIGLEGTISRDDDGKDRIYIEIDKIGYASTEISRMDVEYIRRKPGRPRKQELHK